MVEEEVVEGQKEGGDWFLVNHKAGLCGEQVNRCHIIHPFTVNNGSSGYHYCQDRSVERLQCWRVGRLLLSVNVDDRGQTAEVVCILI